MKTRWLDRRIACPGPNMALVLSQEEFDAALKHLGVPAGIPWISNDHSDATAHVLDRSGGGTAVVVGLRVDEGRSAIEIAGLLVHESVHIWQRYAESIGERNPGDEQEAYAIQAISQELMAEYARRIA